MIGAHRKSHVEHTIDFVEHEDINISKMERALLQMIEQAARCGDNDVGSAFDSVALFAVTDTAVDNGNVQIGEAAIIAKRGLDLRSQFASRFKDETAKLTMMGE